MSGALPEPAVLAARSCGAPVVDHRSSWVRLFATKSGDFFAKTYEYSSWRSRLGNWGRWTRPGRASRAARECEAFAWLDQHNFHTPGIYACFEWRQLGFVRRATVVTSRAPGERADTLLADAAPAAREALAERIGRFVHELHARGFRDRNLDLRNLIVAADRITKIDSPRHRIVPPNRADDALARADWARLLPQLEPALRERARTGG